MMALYSWANTVTQWHFNPNNVRDPTIVFNNTSLVYGGPVTGYSDTPYAFAPINFAPNINSPTASVWTQIKLDQFGVSSTAKQVILTGNCGITGKNEWTGTIYAWFRAPGSNWELSPIFDGGYAGSLSVHAPVALDASGVPAIEMAWGTNGLDSTNWGKGDPTNSPIIDQAWFNLILTGWGE